MYTAESIGDVSRKSRKDSKGKKMDFSSVQVQRISCWLLFRSLLLIFIMYI